MFSNLCLMDGINSILAQKLGLAPATAPKVDAAAASPERQVRRALGRAAEEALGLTATLADVLQQEFEAEELIETGPKDWVVLGLRDGSAAGLSGLFLIDPPLRSALVEMQTMGNLLAPSAEQRRVTRLDAMMAVPFASLFLKELAAVGFGGPDVNPAGYDMGPIEDLRTAGLVMMQGRYRHWKIKIKMGVDDVVGEMIVAMRPPVEIVEVPTDKKAGWSAALRAALSEAPAELDAELTRLTLSIREVEAFEVGQVINLAGTTVGSVRLVGPGGEVVTTARLGQTAGKRAVRIERAKLEMQDDPPKRATAVPMVAIVPPEATKPKSDPQNLVEG